MTRGEYMGTRGKGFRLGIKRATNTPNTTVSMPHPPPLTPNTTLPISNSPLLTPNTTSSVPQFPPPAPNFTLPNNESSSTPPNTQAPIDVDESGAHPNATDSYPRGSRGAYLNKNIPEDPSDREEIHIQGSNYLENQVVRAITKDFKAHFCGKETQWHLLDETLVEKMYKSFEDRYKYEETMDPKIARCVWEERAKIRFRGLWANVRVKCKEKTGSTNPADWKLSRPKFVHQRDWEGIIESWMTEEWKRLSTAGVANRKKVPGVEDTTSSYVRHTGGSISFGIHRKRLEAKSQRKLSGIEFFEKLHKKKKGNGEWCDAKSKDVVTKYNNAIKRKHVPESDEAVDGVDPISDVPFDPQAWVEAAGLPKKNKVYGFGALEEADLILKQTNCPSSSKRSRFNTSKPINNGAVFEMEVQARVAIQMEEFKLTMMQQVQEQVNQMMNGRQAAVHSNSSLGLDKDNP